MPLNHEILCDDLFLGQSYQFGGIFRWRLSILNVNDLHFDINSF